MKSENEMEITSSLPESEPKTEVRKKKIKVSQAEEPEELPRRHTAQKKKHRKKKASQKERVHRSARVYGVLMMLTFVFVISISLAVGIIEIGKDMLGINGSQRLVLFNIPEGATTAQIAQNLHDDGIIKIPKAFIYFSKLSKDDGNFVAGNHEISASMAYETLIDELKKNPASDHAPPRGGVSTPPRRLRPGVAASPLAGKRVHGAGSFAPSPDSAWRAVSALSA